LIVAPVGVWRLSRVISKENGLIPRAEAVAFALFPLFDHRFTLRLPAGLDSYSTLQIGLYTHPLGFLLLTLWAGSYLDEERNSRRIILSASATRASFALLLIKDDCRVLQSFDWRSSPETWLQKIANHNTIRFHRGRNGAMSLEDLSPDDRRCPPSHGDKVLYDEIAHKLKLTKGQRDPKIQITRVAITVEVPR
jgi:hypothetical protein